MTIRSVLEEGGELVGFGGYGWLGWGASDIGKQEQDKLNF